MQKNVCCFIGHRTIIETDELKKRLLDEIENLITDKNVDTFLFGSKSQFDSLCLDLVTNLKKNIRTLSGYTFGQNIPLSVKILKNIY